MIFNSYKYLYYKLFCWSKFVKNFGDVRDHQFYVSAMLSAIMMVYAGIIITLFLFVFSPSSAFVNKILDNSIIFIMVPAVVVFFVNYKYTGRPGFHNAILERYKNEPTRQSIIGNIAVGAFVGGSFVTLVVLWFLYGTLH